MLPHQEGLLYSTGMPAGVKPEADVVYFADEITSPQPRDTLEFGQTEAAVRRTSSFVSACVCLPLLLSSAMAQVRLSSDEARLSPGEASKIAPVLDSPPPNSLKCGVERWSPRLDFAFRFVTGYVIRCRLSQFEGRKAVVESYEQITPEGQPPILFASAHNVPEPPAEAKESSKPSFSRSKLEIGLSGAFGLGEGSYRFEVLLRDDLHRTYAKHWRLQVAASHSERGVALALKPLTVESEEERSWRVVSSQTEGVRLTILVDAAPIFPYQTSLRAWDRAFLLESVYSVLRHAPHRSVHLVAFNLDQQQEIFRCDQFDDAAFEALSGALKQLELSSISVKALKKRNSPEFLVSLANQELAAERADAIVFLGPNTRTDTHMAAVALTEKKATSPPMFYFEYYPWVGAQFPDSVARLVKAASGKVFPIYTPAQFDQSIDKMLDQLKPE